MSSFKITMKDNSHQGIYQLEAAIRNAGEWQKFWAGPDGELSKAWAESRRVMFATQGSSTGPKWPGYTRQEQRYWLPIKRWSLGVKTIQPGGILRWNAKPQSTTAGDKERLWPSMCIPNPALGYVWNVQGNKVEMGTNVAYASNHDRGVGAYTRRTSRKKSGTVTIPTPKRPLVRFGDPFIDAVRKAMKDLAMNQPSGAKVGIVSTEFAVRYLMSVGGKP
jgi:hypothetical protein